MDTIFALASARGKAGVSVVRVSGPLAVSAVSRLCSVPVESHRAALRTLRVGEDVVDQALVILLAGPASFTGEDVVELHLHGSVAIIGAVLDALGKIDGLRVAEAGEFTRCALDNERLDVAQVEGLSDLIEAETEAQRRQAMRVFSGELGEKSASWRKDLIRAAALVEATIDFADEDVPVDVLPEVIELLDGVSDMIAAEVAGQAAAERIRDGFEVAIVGPPNVGKSSLLNALAGREAAITSEVAGTTRDVIEVRMDIAGLPVTFLDTAGIRDSDDAVESIGISRARARAEKADLRIILRPGRDDATIMLPSAEDIVLTTKSDIRDDGDISSVSGAGLQHLVAEVAQRLESRASGAGLAIRARHSQEMQRALTALGIARDRIRATPELPELVAEDIRGAIRALDALVGRVDVEDLLDEIFASFCIGK